MLVNGGAKLSTNRFETAALAHIDSVYRLALYMAGNEDDAQSLVRNTYLAAYRSFSKFEAETICKAWLLGILNTACHNSKSQQIASPPESMRRGARLPDNANDDSFGDDVTNAMKELPAQYRIVILLADVEGLSYEEIASVIGCPIETVVSRLCRGRKLLGKELQARQYGHECSEIVEN